MIDKYNLRKIYFIINYFIIINISYADVIIETLKSNGWMKSKYYKINSPSEIIIAESFVKKVGDSEARMIYLANKKKMYGNKSLPLKYEIPLFLFDDEIHTIQWMTNYHLALGGINFSVNDEKETSAALLDFETLFSRNTKELYKIRRYKGAFGPLDVGGRTLKNVQFLGTNLYLSFLDGGQETTLELGPSFDYISSTVANGRKINPAAVISSPMRSLAEVHRKMEEEGAKMMAAEREKEAAKTAPIPTNEKTPTSEPDAPVTGEAKIPENPQLQVTQDSTPKTLDSVNTTKVDAIKWRVGDYNLWIIAALALISASIVWIFLKRMQRNS